MIDWLDLTPFQTVKGYFMTRDGEIVFIVRSYLKIFSKSLLRFFFFFFLFVHALTNKNICKIYLTNR